MEGRSDSLLYGFDDIDGMLQGHSAGDKSVLDVSRGQSIIDMLAAVRDAS